MKPGYSTTEFWITIIVILIACVIGILAAVFGKNIEEKIASLVALIIVYLKAHGYDAGRVKQKVEEIIHGYITQTPPTNPTPEPVIVPVTPVIPPSPSQPVDITPVSKDSGDSDDRSVVIATKVMKNSTAITTTIK